MDKRSAVAVFSLFFALRGLIVRAQAQTSPHGNYTAQTDACAACHRSHTGPGAPLLYSALSGDDFCYTCHDGSGAPATPVVSTHANGDFLHAAEGTFRLRCVQCHDPHGSPTNLYDIKEQVIVLDGSPPVTGGPVVFTATSGPNSYDDGSSPSAGRICVTCHANAGNPGYPMTDHEGGANHLSGADYSGQDCITCHPHSVDNDRGTLDGFMPTCTNCHGQPPDGNTYPNRDGSHSTHFGSLIGPQFSPFVCDDCHLFSAATHNDGQVTFRDGQPLATTTACDSCHSPGGSYDGVNDAQIGAKANWAAGVYGGGVLQSGKDRWCATCHDESPANSRADGSGVDAPNVIGDEDGAYPYGSGWGYYKTGHGLPGGTYPASEAPAADLPCSACHDLTVRHIDHIARTYEAADDNYQAGYRLVGVGGGVPLDIPRDALDADDFALCLSCHDPDLYLVETDYRTGFRDDPASRNSHYEHLMNERPFNDWDSDWDGATGDSRISCPACHNVHGSPSPRMIRHGELISSPGTTDKVPALGHEFTPAGTYPVFSASTGGKTRFIAPGPGSIAKNGICAMCHNDQEDYVRTPIDLYPPRIAFVYGQVGSATLIVRFSEGVYSNTGGTGNLLPGDFTLTDADDGRTIIGVTHTAGESIAILTLGAPLDANDDIGTDTLAAATTTSIYDAAGNAMDTTPVVISGDSDPPVLGDQFPVNGATGVLPEADLTFTLSDDGSGVDWTSFSIQLTGNYGYSQTYTDADTSVVSKSGSPGFYRVTVNPDTYFGAGETITVLVQVNDLAGNALSHPTWSFTVASGPVWRTPDAIHSFGYLDSPGNLIDDDLNTGNGFGAGGPDHYVTFRLDKGGASYDVTDVRLYGGPTYSSTWQVYVSTDGTSFTYIGSWTVGGASRWYVYTFPSPVTASYIQINDRHGGPEPANAAFEFDFRGTVRRILWQPIRYGYRLYLPLSLKASARRHSPLPLPTPIPTASPSPTLTPTPTLGPTPTSPAPGFSPPGYVIRLPLILRGSRPTP